MLLLGIFYILYVVAFVETHLQKYQRKMLEITGWPYAGCRIPYTHIHVLLCGEPTTLICFGKIPFPFRLCTFSVHVLNVSMFVFMILCVSVCVRQALQWVWPTTHRHHEIIDCFAVVKRERVASTKHITYLSFSCEKYTRTSHSIELSDCYNIIPT